MHGDSETDAHRAKKTKEIEPTIAHTLHMLFIIESFMANRNRQYSCTMETNSYSLVHNLQSRTSMVGINSIPIVLDHKNQMRRWANHGTYTAYGVHHTNRSNCGNFQLHFKKLNKLIWKLPSGKMRLISGLFKKAWVKIGISKSWTNWFENCHQVKCG